MFCGSGISTCVSGRLDRILRTRLVQLAVIRLGLVGHRPLPLEGNAKVGSDESSDASPSPTTNLMHNNVPILREIYGREGQ
jgi:hypothetical protein